MIDADLPNSTVKPFHNEGFETVHVREVDLGTVRDEEVSAYAGMRPTAFPSIIEEFERIGWEPERDVMWYWRDQQSSPRAYQIERGKLIF